MEKKNTNQCLGGLRIEDQGIQSPQTFLVKNLFFLQLFLSLFDLQLLSFFSRTVIFHHAAKKIFYIFCLSFLFLVVFSYVS